MGRKGLQLEARGRQCESRAPGDPVTETRAGELSQSSTLPQSKGKAQKSPLMLLQSGVEQGQEPL